MEVRGAGAAGGAGTGQPRPTIFGWSLKPDRVAVQEQWRLAREGGEAESELEGSVCTLP